MKHHLLKLAAGAASLISLAQPQIVFAQECIEQETLSDTVIYAMPILYSAFTAKCAGKLQHDGFVASEGPAFLTKYTALQDGKWPSAVAFLAQISQGEKADADMAELFSAMPEEALRPFVDAIIQQKLSAEIKPADCPKIERGLSALAPLPPENMGNLVAFLVDMAGVKEPSLCPYEHHD